MTRVQISKIELDVGIAYTISMIDRYLIRYFLAVVDSGNFSRAAQRSNVSQPTLSVGIAKLEELIGAALFHRNNRRVNLTEAGTKFLPYARRIEREFNCAAAAVKGIEPSPVLKLGILNTVSSKMVQHAVRQMIEADPLQRIELVEGSEREILSSISRGRIDIALTIVKRGGNRFREEVLFEEGYVAALPKTHPQAGFLSLSADDLAESVMIVRRQCEALSETSRYFLERGVRPFFAYRSSHDDRALAMVAAGLGVTVTPRSHTWPGVWQAKLTGFDVTRKLGLCYVEENSERARSGSLQVLRDTISKAGVGEINCSKP
ncbi:LysR family transcriptional regulator [Hyphomonas polymorpha PS728]|uniref:LysR family transcriptional regulator n=1 Tax=Hyphomonas polymorpha PS728 TaxID=1280954 RepID=A0A062V923_9PROT|nr:LysR family transcriptional regulator [Hyphomonas polymorpha]KCZ96619.1 LysR family transcriptional regulator [Hyphomonas polymorpha PS728]